MQGFLSKNRHRATVLTKTGNEPKRPEVSQNQPKPHETSQTTQKKLQNEPKHPKI